MDAQLDLQQLPRSTAQRVDPTPPAVPNAVSAPPSPGTTSITLGVRRDRLDVPPRTVDDALRMPAGATPRPAASADHVLPLDESGPTTRSDASAARPVPDRYRHPGRKTHVPDL
ncbi:hypothetical protein GCM10009696_33360 [Kocuria himachalensis]